MVCFRCNTEGVTLDLLDEAGGQEPCELLPNRLALLFVEAVEALLHQLGIRLDIKVVLDDLTGDARYVRGLPREDISVVV